MKLIHLSDLHIGKRLNEMSYIEDQKHILTEILKIVDSEKPDAVLIAGDVYDKSIPSGEAVEILDNFLYSLSTACANVFVISGNHDSPERIAFGGRLMDKSGVHLSPVYDGAMSKFTLSDRFGNVNIYMLPFIRPADVRRFFPDEEINSYTDAVRTAVNSCTIDENDRNVIITHQFVAGANRCDSEDKTVGGTDCVDSSVFDCFDYTALGHIHGPQNVGSEKIRYCGTPLKYSFSEENHKKSVTVVELKEKNNLTVRTIPLIPLRDMCTIKGTFAEISASKPSEDYIRVILSDKTEITDALNKLRYIFPNIMELHYEMSYTPDISDLNINEEAIRNDSFSVFEEFYKTQRGGDSFTDEKAEYMRMLIDEIEEGKNETD